MKLMLSISFRHWIPCLVATFLTVTGCSTRPPVTFIKSFDDSSSWRVVQVRDGLEFNELWTGIVDVIAKKFDIEIVDENARYIRTTWKYTYILSDAVSDRYRSRIIVKFEGNSYDQFSVKCESNWLTENGWLPGFDSGIIEEVYGDLQGRVGRTRF